MKQGRRDTLGTRVTQIVRLLVGGAALFLAGCAANTNTAPLQAPSLVVAYDPTTSEEIITTSKEAYSGSFFSNVQLRETMFSGNTRARLEDQNSIAGTGFLNTTDVNSVPISRSNTNDFEGSLSGDFNIRPLPPQQIDGALWQPKYSERATVLLNYDNEPLTMVIQNILGGILGQNFVIGEEVGGTLTMRSENKFARSQLVQVLADIVAKEGFLLRYFNGVYYVGTADELNQMIATRQGSLTADTSSLVVEASGDLEQLSSLVQTLSPPSVRVGIAPNNRGLLVQGDPSLFPSVESLVATLVDTGVSDQRVAIVTLRESDPETVAAEIQALYEARGISTVTFIPLLSKQAIMIAANSRNGINFARDLVRTLDTDGSEEATLRVLQLTHAPAQAIANQINEVFGNGVDVSANDQAEGGRDSAVLASAADLGSQSASEATSFQAPDVITGGDRGATASKPVTLGGPSVVADERNNSLLIRSTYPEFIRIQKVVRSLDVPLAQVVIEATVLEVDINDELQLGVQVFLEHNGLIVRTSGSSNLPGDKDGAGFSSILNRAMGGTQVSAVVSALQGVSNVKVISSPYVTVANGRTSRLAVGSQIPFTTTSQSSNTDGTVVVTQEIETRDVGVILEVTPTIRPDNSVILDVSQTVSSAGSTATTAGVNPTISQKSVDSQVLVNSGFTVLLGGLISERSETSEGGIPGLRKLPGVGGLFNQRSNTQNRSELLVMITPRVVRNTNAHSEITEQLRWSASTN